MISDSFSLILSLESSYIDIVALSLFVSVTATFIASIFSILSAAYLTINNFKLKNILMLIIHSLLALPPVVIGLVLYILFSNNGILSDYNLLYTVKIMIIAQVILITPILITLCKESFDYSYDILKEYLISIRASKLKQTTNCSTIMGENTPADTVDIKLKDDEIIKIDQIEIKAMYTPGHTSDSYSFLMDNYLFSGDTLLINGTGRTDFQNGSSKDAYNSIFNRLLKLPEDTILYPGHDYNGKESSTIGNEKKFNPRLQVRNVDEYVELMSNLNLAKPQLIDINVSRNIKLGAN